MIVRLAFFIAIAVLAGAGCGLKGSLYLPERKGQEVSSQTSDDEERKERSSPSAGGTQPPAVPTDTRPAPSAPPPEN